MTSTIVSLEARIEWLEKWFAPKHYECCGVPAAGEHSSSCPLYGMPDELEGRSLDKAVDDAVRKVYAEWNA